MKRNVKTVFRFLILAGGTAIVTIILFRLIRNTNVSTNFLMNKQDINGPLPFAPEVR